jgi:hypothetical protein
VFDLEQSVSSRTTQQFLQSFYINRTLWMRLPVTLTFKEANPETYPKHGIYSVAELGGQQCGVGSERKYYPSVQLPLSEHS